MNEMIACCGLICTKCEAFLATKNNDGSKKRKIAASWSDTLARNLSLKTLTVMDACQKMGGVQDTAVKSVR